VSVFLEREMSACLDNKAVFDLFGGRADEAQRAAALEHIQRCADCRALLAETARTSVRTTVGFGLGTAVPTAADATPGRYVLLDLAGAGGMGVVYTAYDPELNRRVALKLLRPDIGGREAAAALGARLRREAQTMAQLSHPNVVAVYDAGTCGDEVFLAMELVQGQTLWDWLRERPRSWREVRDCFVHAGRGLAAAHAAGIVHGDFKPENVLVGAEGRVRVSDFGLARPTIDVAGTKAPAGSPPPLAGTPAYMAPEQFRGEAVDARTDLFSFCVALYEALYGRRPFPGDTLGELRASVLAGRIEPGTLAAPAWLRRILLRGLRSDPEQRYPSMDALLGALSYDPLRRVRQIALVAGAACVATLAVLAYDRLRPDPAERCRGAEAKLAGVWDAEQSGALRAAFLATGAPGAEDAWRAVAGTFDRRARDWVRMHTEACEATQVQGWQSPAALDLRMQCLEEARKDVRSLVAVLAQPDAALVGRAAEVAAKLPSLERCTNVAALSAIVAPPQGAEVRERVAAVRTRIAEARALMYAGRLAPALAIAETASAQAHRIGYAPLRAEALVALGSLFEKTARYAEAERILHEAVWAAEEGRHDEVKAQAWIALAWLVGVKAGARHEEGLRIAEHARAALVRLGGNDEVEASLLLTLGTLYEDRQPEKALQFYERTVTLRERAFGPGSLPVAHALVNVASALDMLGRADARQAWERALALLERLTGPLTPRVALLLNNLGALCNEQGRYAEALAHLSRALSIKERVLGREHPDLGITIHNIGETLRLQGRPREALARYEQALALWKKKLRDGHPAFGHAFAGIGQVYLALGQSARAEALLRRALEIREATRAQFIELAETRFALARSLVGDHRSARALARQALAEYRHQPVRNRGQIAEIERWLRRSAD
jgi:tetratricopeptide (TPR) repeat protein